MESKKKLFVVGILTVSDRVSLGQSQDESGPIIKQMIIDNPNIALGRNSNEYLLEIISQVVPDEKDQISDRLKSLSDHSNASLIITTGGTGFSPRDVTPEATKSVIDREAPGIATAMLLYSLKFTPHAILSRSIAGMRNKTLIINFPGSPKAVRENLDAIKEVLPHAISLLRNDPKASEPKAHHALDANPSNKEVSAPSHSHHHDHHHHGHGHSHSQGHDHPGRRESKWPMIPIDEAVQIALSHTMTLPSKKVPLSKSLGLIVAEDIAAQDALPPFRASIKDGYAICAEDGQGTFPVIGIVTAGVIPGFRVQPGTIARITTGSALPDGANAVIMVESTELLADKDSQGREQVKLLDIVKIGADIRAIGSDISVGEIVLKKGERIGPAEVGLLATVGVSEVPVFDAPKVAVLSTGDELMEPNQSLTPGKIRDSNRNMLLAAVKEVEPAWGDSTIDLGIARDNEADLNAKVMEGLNKADILISTGGVSMGELDLMQPLLQRLGKIHFGRVLMKPGKPLTFATVEINGRKKLVWTSRKFRIFTCDFLFALCSNSQKVGWISGKFGETSSSASKDSSTIGNGPCKTRISSSKVELERWMFRC